MIVNQFWGEPEYRRCMATCCRQTASLRLHVESLQQSLSSAISLSMLFVFLFVIKLTLHVFNAPETVNVALDGVTMCGR